MRANWESMEKEQRAALQLRLGQLHERMNRLTDAFLDGAVERSVYDNRKNALLLETKSVEENLANTSKKEVAGPDRLAQFLELAGTAWLSYIIGKPEKKRQLLNIITSNRWMKGKDLCVSMVSPYLSIAKRLHDTGSDPTRNRTAL